MTVHVLRYGMPLCRFSHDFPAKWPEDHKWVGIDQLKDLDDVTCTSCRPIAENLVNERESETKKHNL